MSQRCATIHIATLGPIAVLSVRSSITLWCTVLHRL